MNERDEQATESTVVMRVIPRERAAGLDVARFKREIAFAASRLEHPNIVPLVDGGERDGEVFYTMERVGGETLDARMARDSKISSDDALEILRDIARGLAHGHSFGILHRAIKPSNVILTSRGAKLSEFGVVRAIDLARGLAPDPRIDNRTDIHDFGAVAYELLSGDAPLGDAPTLIQKRRTDIPHALGTLITRSLATNPDDRPQTASEIANAIDEIISPSEGIFGDLSKFGQSSTVEERSQQFKARGALGLVVIAILAIVAGYFTWRSSQSSTPTEEALPTNAVAVLPFTTAASDSSLNYLASGVTDEVATAVARVPGVSVASRSSMDAATGLFGSDAKQIATRLQASTVVSGSIQRRGDAIAITSQVLNAGNGKVLSSKSYSASAATLANVEDSIARDVATALKIKAPLRASPASERTSSGAAHDAYLRGEFAQRIRTEGDLRRSVDWFQKAVSADPRYVAAWAGLATSWALLAEDFVSPKEAVPQLRDALAHGLALDTSDASLKVLHGVVAFLYDRDAKAAQNYMSPALAGDASLPLANKWYPATLWTNGFRDSASAYLRRIVARDSTSPDALADAWRYARQSSDALRTIEYCGKLRALRASTWCDAWQQLDIGQGDDQLGVVQRQAENAGIRDVNAQLDRVVALVEANKVDEAKRVAGDVDRAAGTAGSYMRPDAIALIHAAVGDSIGAMAWWERAANDGSGGVGALYWKTAKSATRTDPRLAAFAKRIGLPNPPTYWP